MNKKKFKAGTSAAKPGAKNLNELPSPAGNARPGAKISFEAWWQPAHSISKKTLAFLSISVFVLGFLLFANTLTHDYALDDDLVYKLNTSVQKGISGIPEIFRTTNMYGFNGQNYGAYRPLTQAIFAIEYEFFGLNPGWQHLVSVLMFALSAVLLFLLLRRLLAEKPLWITLAATLIFIAHPVHTEVVANIKSRDEIISFIFGFALTFIFLFRFADKRKIVWLVLSLVCFFAGLISKEHIITLLPVIPLTLFFFTGKKLKQIALISVWFLIPAAIFLLLRALFIEPADDKIVFLDNFVLHIPSFTEKAGTIMYILLYYIRLCLLPFPLSCDYSWAQTPQLSLFSLWPLISVMLYGGLVLTAVLWFRKKNIFSWCILFFLFTISIYSHIYAGLAATMAERFLFLPSLPIIIALTLLLHRLSLSLAKPRLRGQVFLIPVLLLFVAFSVMTIARNTVWANSDTLFMNDVKNAPASARLNKSAGDVLINLGKNETDPLLKNRNLREALDYLKIAYHIYPDYPDNLLDMGTAYFYLGGYDSSLLYWNRFAELQPKSPRVQENLQYMASGYYLRGMELSRQKMLPEAMEAYEKSLSYDSSFHASWFNKGLVYAAMHQYGRSKMCMQRAIEKDTGNAEYWYNFGGLLFTMKIYDSAAIAWNKTLQLHPAHENALNGLKAIGTQ